MNDKQLDAWLHKSFAIKVYKKDPLLIKVLKEIWNIFAYYLRY